jgi:hypothetical protein
VSKIRNAKTRALVLRDLSVKDCYYDAVHEITINALKGNIPLKPFEQKGLKKHKRRIKALVCAKRASKKVKSRAFVQSGGWIQFLIPAVGALLGGILNK